MELNYLRPAMIKPPAESESQEMMEGLAQLSQLSTAKQEMIFGIDEKSLPTFQVIYMSFWYLTMLTRLWRSKRNCQTLWEMPEGWTLPRHISRMDGSSFKESLMQWVILQYFNIPQCCQNGEAVSVDD